MIEFEGLPETLPDLVDPVMVCAFEGWNDAGDAASGAVLREILRVALTQGLWRDLLPLAAKLPTEARATVAREVANEDDAHLTALIRSAHEAGMWDSLIPIALAMSEPERQRMAALPLFAESAVLAAIIASAAEHDLWAAVLPLVDALPPKTRDSVAELIAALPEDQRPPV